MNNSERKKSIEYLFAKMKNKSIIINKSRYVKRKVDGKFDIKIFDESGDYYLLTCMQNDACDKEINILMNYFK